MRCCVPTAIDPRKRTLAYKDYSCRPTTIAFPVVSLPRLNKPEVHGHIRRTIPLTPRRLDPKFLYSPLNLKPLTPESPEGWGLHSHARSTFDCGIAASLASKGEQSVCALQGIE